MNIAGVICAVSLLLGDAFFARAVAEDCRHHDVQCTRLSQRDIYIYIFCLKACFAKRALLHTGQCHVLTVGESSNCFSRGNGDKYDDHFYVFVSN